MLMKLKPGEEQTISIILSSDSCLEFFLRLSWSQFFQGIYDVKKTWPFYMQA